MYPLKNHLESSAKEIPRTRGDGRVYCPTVSVAPPSMAKTLTYMSVAYGSFLLHSLNSHQDPNTLPMRRVGAPRGITAKPSFSKDRDGAVR